MADKQGTSRGSKLPTGAGAPPTPRKGAEKAEEIFMLVGASLTYFSGAEDMMMGLFNALCGEREPSAIELYREAPRTIRAGMLTSALDRYSRKLEGDERQKVVLAMKALDKLAQMRNRIAHGHCSQVNSSAGGVQVLSGHFIIPNIHQRDWEAPDSDYAYSHDDLADFIGKVREHRGTVMDVMYAIMMRQQNLRMGLTPEALSVIEIAKGLTFGTVPPEEALRFLQLAKADE